MSTLYEKKRERIKRAEDVGRRMAETMTHEELVVWASMLCGQMVSRVPVQVAVEWCDRLEAKLTGSKAE